MVEDANFIKKNMKNKTDVSHLWTGLGTLSVNVNREGLLQSTRIIFASSNNFKIMVCTRVIVEDLKIRISTTMVYSNTRSIKRI